MHMSIEQLASLAPEEYAVVEWQYRLCGGFKAALWEAICRADEGNLNLLARGFPLEVMGYRKFRSIENWWPNVEDKIRAPRKADNDNGAPNFKLPPSL